MTSTSAEKRPPEAYRVTARNMESSPQLVRNFAERIDRYVASGGGVLRLPTDHNIRKRRSPT